MANLPWMPTLMRAKVDSRESLLQSWMYKHRHLNPSLHSDIINIKNHEKRPWQLPARLLLELANVRPQSPRSCYFTIESKQQNKNRIYLFILSCYTPCQQMYWGWQLCLFDVLQWPLLTPLCSVVTPRYPWWAFRLLDRLPELLTTLPETE